MKQVLKNSEISIYWKQDKEIGFLLFTEHQYVENKNRAISLVV